MVPKIHPIDDVTRTLSLIHQADIPNAIIAGGYIRDLYHEVMFSDVDIYINGTPELFKQIRNPANFSIWKTFWIDVLKLNPNGSSYWMCDEIKVSQSKYDDPQKTTGDGSYITAIWDIYKGGIQYQIILLNNIDPITYVNEHFDFGLCQAFFDGKRIRYNHAFLNDSLNKTITLNKKISSNRVKWAIEEHLPRIQYKYPTFKPIL